MKALVVEDDLKSQCLLAKVLAERAHEVTTFENAEQAIVEYQKEFYPLLFVDVGLPGMDGLQYCQWIRRQPRGQETYVIAAVDLDAANEVQQALEAGVNDFVTKPYQLEQLRARLVVGERQMAQNVEKQQLEQFLRAESQNSEATEAVRSQVQQEGEAALKAKDLELEQLRQELNALMEHAGEALTGRTSGLQDEAVALLKEETAVLSDRCMQLEQALDRAQIECEAGRARARDAEQALESARATAAEVCKADEDQAHDLKETLRLRAEELASCKKELAQAREQLERALREHTGQLFALNNEMRQGLEARQQVENELAAAHQELVSRGREEVDESLRRAGEFRELLEERRRLERALEDRENQRESELKRLAVEREEVERRLQAEAEESKRVRAALAQVNEQLSAFARERDAMADELKLHRDARKRLESRWKAMARLGAQLNRATTAEGVARAAGSATLELIGWDMFSLDTYRADGDWVDPVISLECVEGESHNVPCVPSGPGLTSLMRRVLEDGAQIINRVPASRLPADLVVVDRRTRRSSSLICVPLAVGERTTGFLLVRSGGEIAYNVEDLEVLEIVAAQCAGALERIAPATVRESQGLEEAHEPELAATANA